MKDHYTKCYIKGEGKEINRSIPFEIEDVSAIAADIVMDYKLNPDKIYNLEFNFSANLIECRFKANVKIEREKLSGKRYHYHVNFLNMPESKKIEIDEVLKRACIIKDIESVNKCDNGDCKVTNIKK
jgi:hypothetical protein